MDLSADFHRPSIAADVRDAASKLPSWTEQTPRLPQDNAGTYEPGRDGDGRIAAWHEKLWELLKEGDHKELARVLLDSSHQGSGKTHNVPELADGWVYGDFNPGALIFQGSKEISRIPGSVLETAEDCDTTGSNGFLYVSRNFRSPSIQAIKNQFQEIPTRHKGLIHAPGPEGGFITRTITPQEVKDGVVPDEEATCVFAHRLHSLSARGFSYKDATESFCKERCPHRPPTLNKKTGLPTGGDGSCKHRQNTSGFWEGHEGATEPKPTSPILRCSVQALEGLIQLCPGFIAGSLVFFDESDQLFDAAIKTHNLSKKKLGDLISFMPAQFMYRPWSLAPDDLAYGMWSDEERAEEERLLTTAQQLTEQLLTKLLQLLSQIKNPHGIDHHQVRDYLKDWIEDVIATFGQGEDLELPSQWQLKSDAHLTQADDFERAITSDCPDQIDNLPSPLLPLLIHCVLGTDAGEKFANYALSVTKSRSGSDGAQSKNYRITLTSPSGLLPAIAEASAAVIVGDATADGDLIRQMFTKPGKPIAFRHLKAAAVDKADQADVQFFQVKDMGAMTARNRRDHQLKRLDAIRSTAKQWAAQILAGPNDGFYNPKLFAKTQEIAIGLKVGFIDHKVCALPADGKWFTASARGGNMFQDFDVLCLIGKPIKNVSAALSEYVSLTGDVMASTGCAPEENSPGFIKYQAQLVAAELQQAWERLRIIRRKGQKLIVLFISDADLSGLPIDVIQIKAEDISPAAAHKTEQKLTAITEAICSLAADGIEPEKISTRKVAKTAGVGETTVRRIAQHQTEGKPWPAFVEGIIKAAVGIP